MIEAAKAKAEAHSSEIPTIKTHGTGAEINERSESNGIAAASLGGFVDTTLKPRIGHTMGLSGLLETILLLEEMHWSEFPAIANRTEKDDVYLSSPYPRKTG